jgi:hypothetical protein
MAKLGNNYSDSNFGELSSMIPKVEISELSGVQVSSASINTDNKVGTLCLFNLIPSMKDDLKRMKDNMKGMENKIQVMKNDMKGMNDDMRGMENKIQVMNVKIKDYMKGMKNKING